MAGIPFTESLIQLDIPSTKQKIAEHSKAGRVPVLHHGKLAIWELLAILEYLAEIFPQKNLWPKTIAARAMARSVANEMHGGFSALRNACPMNLRRPRKAIHYPKAVQADIRRIEEIWRDCRARFGKGGKFLFGKFSNADAMYRAGSNALSIPSTSRSRRQRGSTWILFWRPPPSSDGRKRR